MKHFFVSIMVFELVFDFFLENGYEQRWNGDVGGVSGGVS